MINVQSLESLGFVLDKCSADTALSYDWVWLLILHHYLYDTCDT